MHQGLIFGNVVRGGEVDLQHVVQLVSLGEGEDDVGSQAPTHLRPIEVHPPVGGVWSWWQVLVFSPVSKEVSQDLGLDHRPRLVLNGMSR
jgi:hypothetical protein